MREQERLLTVNVWGGRGRKVSRKGGGEVKQERVRVGGKKNVETEKGRREE